MAQPMNRGIPWRPLGALAGLVLAVAAVAPVAAGNNGTIKIHALGTDIGTEDNEPKVCQFDIEGFNLDPGQVGDLRITPHGEGATGSGVDHSAFGPANGDGYARSDPFVLQPGMYLAVLYGKDGDETAKAKSKVFKVTCDEGGGGGGG